MDIEWRRYAYATLANVDVRNAGWSCEDVLPGIDVILSRQSRYVIQFQYKHKTAVPIGQSAELVLCLTTYGPRDGRGNIISMEDNKTTFKLMVCAAIKHLGIPDAGGYDGMLVGMKRAKDLQYVAGT